MKKRYIYSLCIAVSCFLGSNVYAHTHDSLYHDYEYITTQVKSTSNNDATLYNLGAGISDITGPVAEGGFFGYSSGTSTEGLKQCMHARSFIVEDRETGKRVVVVVADKGAVFQSEKLAIVKKLQEKYGNMYNNENVLVTATHTHVGTGGQSHFPLYIVAAGDKLGYGYNTQSFNAVVDGVIDSIDEAHNNMKPGYIKMTEGELLGASINRSEYPYSKNHDLQGHTHNTNKTMSLLKFVGQDGEAFATINWFAVHPTSFSKKYKFVGTDNKGYAAEKFEKENGVDYMKEKQGFISAFAQGDSGDVIPASGNAYSAPGYEGSTNEEENVENNGEKQYQKAVELFELANEPIYGSVDSRHQWVKMSNYIVSEQYTGSEDKKLCSGGLGASFASGGANGPSDVPGFYPGMKHGDINLKSTWEAYKQNFLGGLITSILGGIVPIMDDPCQYPKPVMLSTEKLGMTPDVLPFQIIKIGNVVLVSSPFEITTQAGRRLRTSVAEDFKNNSVETVIVAPLSNSYAGYVTTYEEYQEQHYEGASTQFGPNQLSGMLQIFSGLASSMVNDREAPISDTPKDKSRELRVERPGVILDDKYLSETFGKVLQDVKEKYNVGDIVEVKFRGGHPKNDLHTNGTYLLVEKKVGDVWVKVADDSDWSTTYMWKREGAARSVTTVVWKIPQDQDTGTYRIKQLGDWKNGWTGKVHPYIGITNEFIVE